MPPSYRRGRPRAAPATNSPRIRPGAGLNKSAGVLGCSHPPAAALALGDGAPVRDLARLTLLDLRHPVAAADDEETPRAARDVESWFRERLRQALEAEVVAAGHDLGALLAPPARQDPTTRARCPRCAEEYRLAAGECSGCPGVALSPFVDGS